MYIDLIFSTDYGYMIQQSTPGGSDNNFNLQYGVNNIPHGKKAEENRQATTNIFQFNEERLSLKPGMFISNRNRPAEQKQTKHESRLIARYAYYRFAYTVGVQIINFESQKKLGLRSSARQINVSDLYGFLFSCLLLRIKEV